MAKTVVSDIIVPSIFIPYMIERTAELSRLWQSGVVAQGAELNRVASGAGKTMNLPFWQDLSGASEGLSDSGSLTVNKITADKDIAVKHFRGKAWSANDLVKYLAGDDPMEAIGTLLGGFWARDMQKTILLNTLAGLFEGSTPGPLNGTHVNDIAIEDGDNATADNLIGSDAVIDTAHLLGDHWDVIVAMAMHSVVFKRMQKLDLIEFEPLSEQDIRIPRFLGREVIVDDGLPTEAGGTSGTKYSTYLFARGSVGYGEGGPESDEAIETDRDILAGDDVLVNRRHFILHPRGVAFDGTPAGQTPTTSELADGANWSKKYEDKNIQITKLITNG